MGKYTARISTLSCCMPVSVGPPMSTTFLNCKRNDRAMRGRGRPKKTWKDTINNDLRHWKLSSADPANRMEWRKKLRTNIGAVQPTLSGTDTLNE